MQGWIKLHRKMTEWEWYTNNNTKSLFLHILLMANHTDKQWRGRTIKRGQRLTSLNHLSTETGLSVSQVRTAIKNLELTNDLAQEKTTQYTVFTVVNYESYQGLAADRDWETESPISVDK